VIERLMSLDLIINDLRADLPSSSELNCSFPVPPISVPAILFGDLACKASLVFHSLKPLLASYLPP